MNDTFIILKEIVSRCLPSSNWKIDACFDNSVILYYSHGLEEIGNFKPNYLASRVTSDGAFIVNLDRHSDNGRPYNYIPLSDPKFTTKLRGELEKIGI